jgi:hypothetical protein
MVSIRRLRGRAVIFLLFVAGLPIASLSSAFLTGRGRSGLHGTRLRVAEDNAARTYQVQLPLMMKLWPPRLRSRRPECC